MERRTYKICIRHIIACRRGDDRIEGRDLAVHERSCLAVRRGSPTSDRAFN
jgi:hypothetical protein